MELRPVPYYGVSRPMTNQVLFLSASTQDWKEGWSRLSVHPAFQGGTGKLGLGTLNAVNRIKRLTLVTLSK